MLQFWMVYFFSLFSSFIRLFQLCQWSQPTCLGTGVIIAHFPNKDQHGKEIPLEMALNFLQAELSSCILSVCLSLKQTETILV